ncbi:hypothetical protein BSNK01_16700 [Bacillaceae bacterium]
MDLENICMAYGKKTIIRSLSLHIAEGEIFVLLGPSGSGKTTLLKGIAGIAPLQGGTIRGKEKANIGLVFQEPRLFPHMTVSQNLEFGLRVQGRPAKEREEAVRQLVRVLQLEGLEERYPHQLSGGQQQRVALGRVLILEPDLLLLDEPFSSLDTALRFELIEWLYRLQREKRFTVLWVTHDWEEAFAVADRIGVMIDGELLQTGLPFEVYRKPRSEKVASFFSLPNRFSREQWLRWFPHWQRKPGDDKSGKDGRGGTGNTGEMGWIAPEFLRVAAATDVDEGKKARNGARERGTDGEAFSVDELSGVVQRVKTLKNGQAVIVAAGGAEWEVYMPFGQPLPPVGAKVALKVPFSRVFWYPAQH